MNWFRKKTIPEWYQIYQDRINQHGFAPSILALDMEASDFDTKNAKVLSFGSVLLQGTTIFPSEETHLFFDTSLHSEDNVIIHELVSRDSAHTFESALPVILDKISNHTVLGHYIPFDLDLINIQLRRLGLPKLSNPTLDTLNLALRLDGVRDLSQVSREPYSLYTLCERFGIEVEVTHDALADAYYTALVYLHLVR